MFVEPLAIPRDSLKLAANLHLPDDFDPGSPAGRSALVLSTPGSSVKEQIGSAYASRLAEQGFVALTFDPLYQGKSEGRPRDREDPYRRSEDISYAIDALSQVPGVDPGRIGLLGICAGGGYAVFTARTDHRIKALGTVVATEMGAAWRSPAFAPDGAVAALDALAEQRLSEISTGKEDRVNWLPDTVDEGRSAGIDDVDTLQAMAYYRTSRGYHANSTNRRLRRTDSLLTGFDSFHLVDQLLTQPLQVILAGREGVTRQHETGMRLWNMAPNPTNLMVVEGAGHYEMYDVPKYVDAAVVRLAEFYGRHL